MVCVWWLKAFDKKIVIPGRTTSKQLRNREMSLVNLVNIMENHSTPGGQELSCLSEDCFRSSSLVEDEYTTILSHENTLDNSAYTQENPEHEFIGADISDEEILGYDFPSKHHCTINVGSGKWSLHDGEILGTYTDNSTLSVKCLRCWLKPS